MKTGLIALIIIGLLIPVIPINYVEAGSATISTHSLQNTRIATSFSYPDSLYWEDDISLPVSLSVIFENPNIVYASIWKVRVRLVEITANPAPTDPDTLYSYAIGGNQSMDPIFDPLYFVENPAESMFVGRIDFEIANISWVSVLQSSVEAKIFLEISLTLVDTDGNRYSRTVYTADQQPTVTIQSRAGATPTSDSTFPLGSVALIVVIIIICLLAIVVIFKRRKS